MLGMALDAGGHLTHGFRANMDTAQLREVADIVHHVLSNTRPGTKNDGQTSLVKFETEASALRGSQARAADLLTHHPLYPELDLALA
jgi:glycine hydroxymethyltransferase